MKFQSLTRSVQNFGLVLSLSLLGTGTASAANFSFVGNFNQDDNVQLFGFNVGAASNVTLRTWSYAGGVNAAGAAIASGGFDPILAVFDSTGALIGQNDDGGALVAADAVTGAHFDTYLDVLLNPGDYTVAVMQFDNFAKGPNLADGFVQQGSGNFTGGFVDVTGHQRDSHWAFDILNVNGAVQVDAPEPASIGLLAMGLTGMAGYGLRSRRKMAVK